MTDLLASLRAPIHGAAVSLTGAQGAEVALERPGDPSFGDYATGVAMRLAPMLRRPPRQIAEDLASRIRGGDDIRAVEIAGPGFINLWLAPSWYHRAVRSILHDGPDYGRGDPSRPERLLVELVSANPTGPLTLGSARNAAYGDAVARLLRFAGHTVTREYYFNDGGRQIELFGESLRAARRGGEAPDGGYSGPYVDEIAAAIELPDEADTARWSERGTGLMFDRIKDTLRRFRVDVDIWFSEASLHESGAVAEAIGRARAGGHVYEREGATWLATSAFGDDKDRVVLRANGAPTYFAADLAYVDVKFRRGHERVFYVLGADHHGYVGRLAAAAACLGYEPSRVEVLIYQLVTVSGERMGKRRGNVVFADELAEAIGVDAARYFLVQRSHDQVMDIDLDLAAERTQKNPVYYVQYAHARAMSILRKAADEAVALPPVGDWSHEPEPGEAALVKRLAEWPEVAADAAVRRAPHKVVSYAHDLAADFHVFHHNHRVLHEEADVRGFRLALTEATGATIRRALDLVGVEAPDSM